LNLQRFTNKKFFLFDNFQKSLYTLYMTDQEKTLILKHLTKLSASLILQSQFHSNPSKKKEYKDEQKEVAECIEIIERESI